MPKALAKVERLAIRTSSSDNGNCDYAVIDMTPELARIILSRGAIVDGLKSMATEVGTAVSCIEFHDRRAEYYSAGVQWSPESSATVRVEVFTEDSDVFPIADGLAPNDDPEQVEACFMAVADTGDVCLAMEAGA